MRKKDQFEKLTSKLMKDYDKKGTNRKMDLVQNVSSLNDKQQLQGVKNQET